MMALLLTPIGRYLIAGVGAIIILSGFYLKIQHDAQSDLRAKAVEDALRRTENAESAARRIPADPDRVRDPDVNERHE
jgi:hypothetical protein